MQQGVHLLVDRIAKRGYTVVTQKEKCMRVEVQSLYRVQCTEYERGYGQRDMGVYFFTTEEEARKFCEEYASGDSECFYRASYTKVA
jgi:gamma-glutamyl phosphate reductase